LTAPLASDDLRSELIFLPADGSLTRFDDGFVLLTPSNPTYWWGNSLRFDHAPRAGDFQPWMQAFEARVHAVQPASSHRTFGWDGDQRGVVEPFVAAGFAYFEVLGLTLDRGDPFGAPRPNRERPVTRVAGAGWDALLALLVETRDPKHTEDGYRTFQTAQIAGWRALEAAGQGCWFAVQDGGRIVSALGVFVEKERGADGRRIGRFQHVVTDPSRRRQGLCGTLVEHASRYAFAHLDADSLRISADENDVARRVYESCGYRITSRHRGVECGS